jgi:hypothetical protein
MAAKGWGVVALTVIVLGGWVSFRDAPPRAQPSTALAGRDTRLQLVPTGGPASADGWAPPTTTVSPITEYSSSNDGGSGVIAQATKPAKSDKEVGKEAKKTRKKAPLRAARSSRGTGPHSGQPGRSARLPQPA